MVFIIQDLVDDEVYSGVINSQLILIVFLVILLALFFGVLLLYIDLKKRHKSLKMDWEGKKRRIGQLEHKLSQFVSHYNKKKETIKHEFVPTHSNKVASKEIALDSFEEEPKAPVVDFEVTKDLQANFNEKDQLMESDELANNNILYLAFPDRESTFYAPEATSTPNEDTFYKIEDDNLVLYDKVNDKQMKVAMNFVENHIKRVCNIANAREPDHTIITMVSPGSIRLQEDDYIVTKKMKVIYD